MNYCRFCGVAIDPDQAQAAAAIQDQVGRACNDASYLKVMARAMPIFYLATWIPSFRVAAWAGVTSWAFLFLLFAIPIMSIRWWMKYQVIQTGDVDYEEAKNSTLVALVIWSVMVLIWIISSLGYFYFFDYLASEV